SVELTKNPDAMISALRKIEGRGELIGATSAVMELCVDNPREGFTDLFATHPSVESRGQALVKYAGGHYLGPLPPPSGEPGSEPTQPNEQPSEQPSEADGRPLPPPSSRPWDQTAPDAGNGAAGGPWGNQTAGPWGPR